MKTLNLFITISFLLIMTSLDGQNIGIATTSPLYRLDIDAITGTTGNPARFLGLMAGATSDSIISSSSGILRRLSISQIIGSGAWSTIGNSGLAAGTNFIGNTDAIDLAFRTNNTERMRILSGGNTGIGTTTPVNLLDVNGGVVIGATYGGTNTAPTNGLLVEGYVGVGTTTANTALDLNGGFSLRPSSVSLTADNQAVTVGNASSIVFTSNSGAATSRTFTLSNGLQNGQLLILLVVSNAAELVNTGNVNLTSTYAMSTGNTVVLYWYSTKWYELSRGG